VRSDIRQLRQFKKPFVVIAPPSREFRGEIYVGYLKLGKLASRNLYQLKENYILDFWAVCPLAVERMNVYSASRG